MNTLWIDDNDDKEMQHAWSQLVDPVMEHRGECWQYMGSWNRGNGWEHTFRHRIHPATNDRATVHVSASDGWPNAHGSGDGEQKGTKP